MYRRVFCVVILLGTISLQAQDKEVEYAEQTWLAYFNQTRFSEKSGMWADLHLRFTGNFKDDLGVSIARLGYTYYITNQTRFTVGYAYATQYGLTPDAPDIPEHRPWQQIQWIEKKSWLTMMQWIRLEERFRKKVEDGALTDDYSFNYRVRFNMAISIPLKGKEVVPKVPFLFLNDELHINFGEEITNNYFDQNRLFLGLGYQFNKAFSAQLGYMKVFQQLSHANSFRNIDAIRLFVFHNLDFRNREE